MIVGRIVGATRALGAPADWDAQRDGPCSVLHIRDEKFASGLRQMVSAWYPTTEELAAMVDGAPVYLTIIGSAHPPVMLAVGKAEDRAEDRKAPQGAR